MFIAGLMLAASASVAATPVVEELEDIERLPPAQRDLIIDDVHRAGVLVKVSQLDSSGVPNGAALSDSKTLCGIEEPPIYEPFDGDERDASQCGGYFVTDRLFLTAAHCLSPLSVPEFDSVRIGRGYTSPTARLQLFSIGNGVYSKRLGKEGVSADWVLLEACTDPAECGNRKQLHELVEEWRDSFDVRPGVAGRRAGYLVSSPLGFHLHVSRGEYQWDPRGELLKHWMPVWRESSGGGLFDEDGTLVGIQQGAEYFNHPHCRSEGGKCVVRFQLPPGPERRGSFIPVHLIVRDMKSYKTLNPRSEISLESFKRRVEKSKTVQQALTQKGIGIRVQMEDPVECLDCSNCN